jgi:hypothetical protein
VKNRPNHVAGDVKERMVINPISEPCAIRKENVRSTRFDPLKESDRPKKAEPLLCELITEVRRGIIPFLSAIRREVYFSGHRGNPTTSPIRHRVTSDLRRTPSDKLIETRVWQRTDNDVDFARHTFLPDRSRTLKYGHPEPSLQRESPLPEGR